MSNVAIRPATPDDLDQIEALVEAAYTPWIDRIGAIPGPLSDDYAALITAGRVTVLVNDEILGVLVMIPREDAMLLDNIAVAPDAQGRGASKLLMNWAEGQAQDMGYDLIRLYTHADMTENQQLYWRRGYRPYRRVIEKGLPRVYMEKWIGRHP